MAQSFVRVVIQIQMRDLNITGGQRLRIDAETMILRRNLYLLGQ